MKLKSVKMEFTCSLDDILVPGFLNKEFNKILSCPTICSENDAEVMKKFYNLESDFWDGVKYIEAEYKNGSNIFLINNYDGQITLTLIEGK